MDEIDTAMRETEEKYEVSVEETLGDALMALPTENEIKEGAIDTKQLFQNYCHSILKISWKCNIIVGLE